MSEYLFSYGTLLPQHAPSEVGGIVSKLRHFGEGTVRGVLYDLGDYPGAVLDPSSDKRILGTVFRLPEDPNILVEFDRYEGFNPSTPGTSLFLRKRYPVELATGPTLECWIYDYNGKRVGAPVVTNGRYRPRHTAAG